MPGERMDKHATSSTPLAREDTAPPVPSPLQRTSWPPAPSRDLSPGQPTPELLPTPADHPQSPPSTIASLTRAEKYERLAFTFCKMGTIGLLAWLLTPSIFVLLVAVVAVALYGRALTLGLTRSRCFLRKPALIVAFWAVVAVADAGWLVWSHWRG